ncbi:MAG: VCBS repeat-containing protein [Planctomycetota bacterium]
MVDRARSTLLLGTLSLIVFLTPNIGAFAVFATLGASVTVGDPREIRVGDLNGDGHLDCVTGSDLAGVSVFLGDGTGGLAATGQTLPGRSVALGDLDLDGDLDLVIGASQDGEVHVRVNDGTGTFATSGLNIPVVTSPGNGLHEVELADLNGDGDLDIVISRLTGANVVLGLPGADFGAGSSPIGFPSSRRLELGDVDGDGNVDVVTTAAGGVSVNFGNGNGSFLAVTSYPINLNFPMDLRLMDVDLDGQLDVAVAGDQHVHVLSGDWTAPPHVVPVLSPLTTIAAGDVNGDGYPDLVTNRYIGAGECFVRLNNGDGTFQDSGQTVPVSAPGLCPTCVTTTTAGELADLDGDGRLDLIASIIAFSGTGYLTTRLNAPVLDFIRGDANHDGMFDLADGISILNHLFGSSPPSTCLAALDVDNGDSIDIGDAIYTFQHLFIGGPPPPAPHTECGSDATTGDLTCIDFEGCP